MQKSLAYTHSIQEAQNQILKKRPRSIDQVVDGWTVAYRCRYQLWKSLQSWFPHTRGRFLSSAFSLVVRGLRTVTEAYWQCSLSLSLFCPWRCGCRLAAFALLLPFPGIAEGDLTCSEVVVGANPDSGND